MSSLVGELLERGLAREGEVQRAGNVGRPGQDVELDGAGVCGIGLEVNVDYAAALILDLAGAVVHETRIPLDVPSAATTQVLDRIAALATEATTAVAARGGVTVGVTCAVPGLVDVEGGSVRVAPNLGWRDVDLVGALDERLGAPPYPIRVDNDANLSALAEYVMGAEAGTPDLVYLTGEVGVGGGVISGGRLLRGSTGFSGEVGHLPLDPDGHRCGCGRRGCWETVVGLAALLRDAADADDAVRDPRLDLERRLVELSGRAASGDPRTVAALRRVGRGLGLGASILVNLFDPDVIVLGGYFASLGAHLLEPLREELTARVLAPDAAGTRVVLSEFGFTAAIRGGAHLALDSVMAGPTSVPVRAGTGGGGA